MRMPTSTRASEGAPARHGLGAAPPAVRFGFHALEMCVVMCLLGGGLLSAVVFGAAALLGSSELTQERPELSTLIVAANLAVAMVVWMRFRGMDWRPTIEMAGSSVVAGVLVVVAHRADLVEDGLLVRGVCGPACLAMVVVMLFRFRLYADHHAGHSAHAA